MSDIEVRRALRRVDPDADPAEITDRCTAIALDPAIIETAGRLAPASLRSLDAIHVATAMAIGPDIDAFITFDRRQAAAAAEAGLPVEALEARQSRRRDEHLAPILAEDAELIDRLGTSSIEGLDH